MGSVRSWAGSILSLLVFLVARRHSAGIAAPTFVALLFAFTYVWALVLRVPQLGKFKPQVEESSASPAAASPEAAPATPAAPAAPSAEKAAVLETADASSAPAAVAPPEQPSTSHAETTLTAHVSDDQGAQSSASKKEEEAPVKDVDSQPTPAAAEESPEAQAAGDEVTGAPRSGVNAPRPLEPTDMGGAEASEAAAEQAPPTLAAATPAAAPLREGHSADSESDADSVESMGEEERRRRDEDALTDPKRAQELRLEGNEAFKAGKVYDAKEAYSEAIYLTPSNDKKGKAVLFANRAACSQKLSRWEDTMNDCKEAIELDPEYVKAYTRRSIAFENLGRWHDAHEDLKKAIELDPSLRSREYRRQAMLEKRSQEQFEKDKEEMMGKLKELGNTVLGKFGMSMDNFKCEQDESGSYSIKYGG